MGAAVGSLLVLGGVAFAQAPFAPIENVDWPEDGEERTGGGERREPSITEPLLDDDILPTDIPVDPLAGVEIVLPPGQAKQKRTFDAELRRRLRPERAYIVPVHEAA